MVPDEPAAEAGRQDGLLCGEGRNELGSRHGHASFQSDDHPGVLEALLRRVKEHGWRIVGARNWQHISKLRARGPSDDEAEWIARLILEAEEHGASILAYTRDSDDEADSRIEQHRRGRERGAEIAPDVRVIGGLPKPSLEGWVLAMHGVPRTEEMTRARATELAKLGFREKDTAAFVAVVEKRADLFKVDADALRAWCEDARAHLDRPSAVKQ